MLQKYPTLLPALGLAAAILVVVATAAGYFAP